MKKLMLGIALLATTSAGCYTVGSAGCPSMTYLECPEGQVEVCETTDEGRCCTCDTPKNTAPAGNEGF